MRAIISPPEKRSDGLMFHATNRGFNARDIAKHAARSGDAGSIMLRIYWAIAEPDPKAILRTFRENIAYNTLQ